MARLPFDPWFVAGSVGLAGFFALEASLRRPGPASSLAAGAEDDGTTASIVRASALSGATVCALRLLPGPRLPGPAAAAGLAVEAAGIGLRAWSMRTLGDAYTRTLRTGAGQQVVEQGPYAMTRHPGYLGSLITWLGFALTSRRPTAVVLVGMLLGDAYRRRIVAEERLLREELPGYVKYAARTRRLIPGIW